MSNIRIISIDTPAETSGSNTYRQRMKQQRAKTETKEQQSHQNSTKLDIKKIPVRGISPWEEGENDANPLFN
jgi:hypothetical protein